ncbi:DUF948 domain-containing protein [Lactobacillus bombicola]|uniref:DUF948 domain-containing protein n=1 Tax=Lactobacillus bombicola TaxID=1505723 RepID=A0A396SP03_9LACO|nr:DUF948 domain-containing protein [Lactobacillus bombicola]RHW49283.1 DUF948 domain-containing protein [Lactobacillus bombicola]RHW52480.1 DUF948 domain-containing protein [Lactobacillus bombicola]RHW53905.1 DUF948 domain-containing protein [Lactobacillus bombicola]
MIISYGALAGLIAAVALLILVLFTIPVLIRVAKAAKEVNKTIQLTNESIQQVTKDVDELLDQTGDLLDKTNVLMADVNVKMKTMDPVVQAAADLGVSVSDVNASSRRMAKKVSNFHLKRDGIMSSALTSVFARRRRRKGKD